MTRLTLECSGDHPMPQAHYSNDYDRLHRRCSPGNALTVLSQCSYTWNMQVNISPELQAKLDRIAEKQGRDAESLVNEAVERLVSYDEWFVRQVERGLAQIERGEVFKHEEVAAKVENLLREKQRRT